jgi:bacterial/archaeal transporter family-2 protein
VPNSPETTNSRWLYLLAVAMSTVSGALVAVQARINGELGIALADGTAAALISFGSGWALITLALALSKRSRAGVRAVWLAIREGQISLWLAMGGVAGAFFVLGQGLTAGILGVALFSVAVVAGQTIGALVIDGRGLVGLPKTKLTPPRIIGAMLALLGAAITASGAISAGLQWQFLLPLLAGVAIGWQQAANGRIRKLANSAIAATFINFTVGTLALLVAKLATLPTVGLPQSLPSSWWLYAGGLIGVAFIAVQSITVNRIGVLALGVALVSGQLIGSLLLDLLLPVAGVVVTPLKIGGLVITLLGALLVVMRRRS